MSHTSSCPHKTHVDRFSRAIAHPSDPLPRFHPMQGGVDSSGHIVTMTKSGERGEIMTSNTQNDRNSLITTHIGFLIYVSVTYP